MSRTLLRVKCPSSKHVVAKIEPTDDGSLLVRLSGTTVVGWLRRGEPDEAYEYATVWTSYPLLGDQSDGIPEAWGTEVGCACGQRFELGNSELIESLDAGKAVLVLAGRAGIQPAAEPTYRRAKAADRMTRRTSQEDA